MLSIGAFIGFAYMGPITNIRVAMSENTAERIAELKRELPPEARERMVSLGRVHHLFAYYYRDPIEPVALDFATIERADWQYFCFDQPGDSPPVLPFAWEELAVISCEKNRLPRPEQKVVVGRRLLEQPHTAGRADDHARK
jgi:hypothetical protein